MPSQNRKKLSDADIEVPAVAADRGAAHPRLGGLLDFMALPKVRTNTWKCKMLRRTGGCVAHAISIPHTTVSITHVT